MSVYIKGMEMPTNCEECLLSGDWYCNALPCIPAWHKEYVEALTAKTKMGRCPLIPIHDHGDLIDRDAYKAEMKKRQDNCAEWRDNAKADGDMEIYHRADGALSVFCEAKLTLDKMPTIIPADHADKEAGE